MQELDGPDWQTAAATLWRLECQRAVPKLFALLTDDPNVDVREDAASKALLDIGRPAFQHAMGILRRGEYEERRTWRLLSCLPAVEVSLLITAAADPSVEVRVAIARLLPSFHAYLAVLPTHLKLLEDRNPIVRLEAVESLSHVKEPEDQLAPALLEILKNPLESDRLRDAAGNAIGYLKPSVAVCVLKEELGNRDAVVRRIATYALSKLEEKSREAVPRLEKLLRDPDEDVRIGALFALEKIGATLACLMPAIEFLEAGKKVSTAASVVSQLGPAGAPAVPALIRDLERSPPGSRIDTIHALGQIGLAASAAVLLLHREFADESSSNARVWAARALGRIGPAALDGGELFVEFGLRDDPWGCRDGLVLLGTAAVPAVIRALHSQDPKLRALAAEYLGGFGPAAGQAVPDLSVCLADTEPQPAEKAAWALGRIGPPASSAVPALVALLGRIFEEQISCDQEVIAESLGRIGVKDDPVPALLRRMATRDGTWFNAHALLALGRLGVNDDETVKLLRAGLGYYDLPVSYCSAHALLYLHISDERVDVALAAAWSEYDLRFTLLKLHAGGFPREVKRVLPSLVECLGDEESIDALVANRLAELGPEGKSVLVALQEAKTRLLEQRQAWAAENRVFDSGGSHLTGRNIADALKAIDAAIESISQKDASTSHDQAPEPSRRTSSDSVRWTPA